MSENEKPNETPMTPEELEKQHDENVRFLSSLLPMLYDNGEDDDPADEQLIPPDILKQCERIENLRRKEALYHKKLN